MTAEPLHAYLQPKLRELLRQAGGALARLEKAVDDPESDTKSVHDLRVATRRLRTLLRLLGSSYPPKRVAALEDELGILARKAGEARDEEVLFETLASLNLDLEARAAIEQWKLEARLPMVEMRRGIVRLFKRGGRHVRAFGDIAVAISLGLGEAQHAVQTDSAFRSLIPEKKKMVRAYRGADIANTHDMHELRIRYKRLRYALEAFESLCSEEDLELTKHAKRMQRALGELHDWDFAIAAVEREHRLTKHVRDELLAKLHMGREHTASGVTRKLSDSESLF